MDKRKVYLDNSATTQVRKEVLDAFIEMLDFLRTATVEEKYAFYRATGKIIP